MVTPENPFWDLLTKPARNESFEPFVELSPKFWAGAQQNFTKSEFVKVFVYDFSGMKQIIHTILNKVKKERKQREVEIEKKLNDKLSEEIGFNPNIHYVFSIFCNNIQAMLATQYDVAEAAHKKRTSRNDDLKNYSTQTDLPLDEDGNAISYPWPTLHKLNQNEGTSEEEYIGNSNAFPNLKVNNFPEIEFITEFLQNYISKKAELFDANKISTKIATGGRDTNNWFPINPIDFRDNPYFNLITESSISAIEKQVGEILCLRAIVSKNYSFYDTNSLEDLGKVEGINAYKTLFRKDGSSLKLTKLISNANFNSSSLISRLVADNILKHVGNIGNDDEYKLVETSGVNASNYKISGKVISGYRNKNADFILIGDIDEVEDIWDNSKSLWKEIVKDKNGKKRKCYERLMNTPREHKQNPVFYKKKS